VAVLVQVPGAGRGVEEAHGQAARGLVVGHEPGAKVYEGYEVEPTGGGKTVDRDGLGVCEVHAPGGQSRHVGGVKEENACGAGAAANLPEEIVPHAKQVLGRGLLGGLQRRSDGPRSQPQGYVPQL
jgi:hypothetical protein